MSEKFQSRLDLVLGIVLALGMVLALYMAFIGAPREVTMGDLQRIFYFHVGAAIAGMTAFAINFAGSLMYILRKNRRWDSLALAAAEVGVVFLSMVLVTGPIWAKPVWFIWWTWSPRLTLSLVLCLLYVAYLLIRNYIEDPERRAMVSAVFGIIAFLRCAARMVFDPVVAGHSSIGDAGNGRIVAGHASCILCVFRSI